MRYWRRTGKADPALVALADRHYSRQQPGTPQFTPPGQTIALILPAFWPYRALAGWVWHRPMLGKAKRMDGYDGFYNCSFFRNESDILSSELIKEAILWALDEWRLPIEGYDTYVNPAKIRSTNPGYCYLKAGWQKNGWSKDGLKRRLYLRVLKDEHRP